VGPQGATGPAGAPGAQGASAAPLVLTARSGAQTGFNLPAQFTATYTTSCSSGELISGGGYSLAAPPEVKVIDSFVSGAAFQVTLYNTAGGNEAGNVTVSAQCLKGASAITTRNTAVLPVGLAGGQTAAYSQTCNAGEILTGGGFSLAAPPPFKIIDSYVSGGVYHVTVYNTGNVGLNGQITLSAQCLG